MFNNGATGLRHTKQQYYTLFAQDEWHATSKLTLNYGLRYEYYTPLKVRGQPDRQVQHRHRPDRSEHHAAARLEEEQLPAARVGDLRARGQDRAPQRLRRLRRPGPGRGPDPADRERSRQHDAEHRSAAGVPDQPGRAGRQLHQQPEQPQLPAARLRARNTRFPRRSTSTPRRCSRSWAATSPRRSATSAARGATCSCAASPTRSPTSSPTRTRRAPRSSSASSRSCTRDAAGNVTGVQNPYAEVDFKTSGGHDSYNALMLSLNRRSAERPRDEHAVHARPAAAARRAARTRRTRRPTTPGRSEQFEYDDGYNNFDVRHTFNVSLLYSLPVRQGPQVRQQRERAWRRRCSAAGTSAASSTRAAACRSTCS